ncbi:MAG: amino acid ABC transporter substrate-binding protein [Burkholderiales bacterium]|nr:MAG: amino acid ABC transporter substrate-binding protein [Burkholderiales bacterium]
MSLTRLRRCLFALVCLLSASAAQAQVDDLLDRIRADGKLVLAHRESSVPFSYLDAQGRPVGYALDICLRLARAVQQALSMERLEVAYLPVTPANRIEAIEKGLAQLECGSTTNNAARRKQVDFTIPHFITGARFLVKAGRPIDRIDHPEMRKVVSTRNTTPLTALRRIDFERMLRLEIIEAEDHQAAVRMVEEGKADAFAMDDVLLYGLAAGRADPRSLKVVGRFFTTEPLAIMLPRNQPGFKKIVDDEMRRLIYSGDIREIYRRWFEAPIPPNNVALNLPSSYLLRDLWKYPTDKMP